MAVNENLWVHLEARSNKSIHTGRVLHSGVKGKRQRDGCLETKRQGQSRSGAKWLTIDCLEWKPFSHYKPIQGHVTSKNWGRSWEIDYWLKSTTTCYVHLEIRTSSLNNFFSHQGSIITKTSFGKAKIQVEKQSKL